MAREFQPFHNYPVKATCVACGQDVNRDIKARAPSISEAGEPGYWCATCVAETECPICGETTQVRNGETRCPKHGVVP